MDFGAIFHAVIREGGVAMSAAETNTYHHRRVKTSVGISSKVLLFSVCGIIFQADEHVQGGEY